MRYAVVTGASSGIGTEMAKILSRMGYGLILVARREDRLQALARQLKNKAEIFAADLSVQEECERLGQYIKNFDVGVFINNAGFGDCGYFAETDLEKELQMIDVNITALHILSKIAIRQMKEKGGYLMNVGSSAGLLPAGPYMATYYATKAYVASFTQALSLEQRERRSNIHVSVLCPGPVDTEFNSVANGKCTLRGISAKLCARYALRKMFQDKTVIVPGFPMKAAIFASRFFPRGIVAKITARQQKKKLGNA